MLEDDEEEEEEEESVVTWTPRTCIDGKRTERIKAQ